MGKKAIVAVNDKAIETCINGMVKVDVLSTLRKREQIFDKVINLNPQVIILSQSLGGKVDFREIISRLREIKPYLKIVFLYGKRDDEFRYFANYLIENQVYNFLEGDINEYNLEDIIIEDKTLSDVYQYKLNQNEEFKDFFSHAAHEEKEKEEEQSKENLYAPPPQEKEIEVLMVEKIIEKETIQTQVIGNVKIGIASLFSRAGCTHFCIELATYLKKQKKDVGVVLKPTVYNSLKEYYLIKPDEDCIIEGVHFYSNYVMALNNHKGVIFDLGLISAEEENTNYFEMNCKVMMCPTSAWEIDKLSNFIISNEYAKKLDYVFYPVTDKYFRELNLNLRRNGCRGYKMEYNPDYFTKSKDNHSIYQKITMAIMSSL